MHTRQYGAIPETAVTNYILNDLPAKQASKEKKRKKYVKLQVTHNMYQRLESIKAGQVKHAAINVPTKVLFKYNCPLDGSSIHWSSPDSPVGLFHFARKAYVAENETNSICSSLRQTVAVQITTSTK